MQKRPICSTLVYRIRQSQCQKKMLHNFFLKGVLLLIIVTLTLTAHAQKKVAVVTFLMNKKVQAGDLGLGAEAVKKSADLTDNPAFNLEPMFERLHETFFNDLSKKFPFELIDENNVIGNQEYKDYELKFDEDKGLNKLMLSSYNIYEGYKYLRVGGKLTAKEKRDEYNMSQIFKEADGVIFVSMWFEFKKKLAIGGVGTAGINAFMGMQLFDKEGNKAFRYGESATSKKSVGMVAGIPIMDIKKIMPMCEDAFEKMLVKIEKDIPKLIKKVDKKL